jgi:hypothetical protein
MNNNNHNIKLSEELQDFILYVAFGFVTDDLCNKMKNRNTENVFNTIPTNKKELDKIIDVSTANLPQDKIHEFDKNEFEIFEWLINENIRITITKYLKDVIECLVYQVIPSINKSYSFVLVGEYSKNNNSVKFYKKNKNNNIQIISPYEYNGKIPAQVFAIGLFYTMNIQPFSPNWEKIAKNILLIS